MSTPGKKYNSKTKLKNQQFNNSSKKSWKKNKPGSEHGEQQAHL
jgi:hypothetical protein